MRDETMIPDQRNRSWFELDRTLRMIWSMIRDKFHYPRLLQVASYLAVDTSMDGASIFSLGNLCQSHSGSAIPTSLPRPTIPTALISLQGISKGHHQEAHHHYSKNITPTCFFMLSISARILWITRLSSEISILVSLRLSPCLPAVACSSSYWWDEAGGAH